MLSDAGLTAVADHCHHLRTLQLDHVDEVTDSGLRAIAGNCRQLISVTLTLSASCSGVTDEGLAAISDSSAGLRSRVCFYNRMTISDAVSNK